MMSGTGLALTQSQIRILHDAASRVLPQWRSRYIAAVSDQLQDADWVDDAVVAQACRYVLDRMPSRERVA
jgi:hypothetical protein